MIIDNKENYGSNNGITTVWDYIHDYTNPANDRIGKLDIVTGFFSVAALSILYKELSPENKYRIVLGDISDIARDEGFIGKVIDLLQGDSSIENAVHLSDYAKNAVEFLKRETVKVKTISNSFCHAKTYLYEDSKDSVHDYSIMGSSNLTEAGLGLRESPNVELNSAETGRDNNTVKELKMWFKKQWEEVAKAKVTVPIEKGKEKEVDAKTYLIDIIEKSFKAYTPQEIYYKILFEFFKADIEEGESLEHQREMKLLKNSVIWNTLFDYQQNGVVSLVKLLNKYNGAILADAVGLGKTFTTLGVIKYFQNNGYFTLVLCPKKLHENWQQYAHGLQSVLDDDHFEFKVRNHTDLQGDRIDKYGDLTLDSLQNYQKLLVVVDESHNLRSHTSSRYKMLRDEIIAKSNGRVKDVKVLLLSATPINTGLLDVRNQFKLIGNNQNPDFYKEFHMEREFGEKASDALDGVFGAANTKYKKWCMDPNRNVNTFKEELEKVQHFFDITNELIVARNRDFIKNQLGSDLKFPLQQKPVNYHNGINGVGRFSTIEAVYDAMKQLLLTAYQPTQYNYPIYPDYQEKSQLVIKAAKGEIAFETIDWDNDTDEQMGKRLLNTLIRTSEDLWWISEKNWLVVMSVKRYKKEHDENMDWQDNTFRELYLSSMMISMFVKRLESSWSSCRKTLKKVLDLHQQWLGYAESYKKNQMANEQVIFDVDVEEIEDSEDDPVDTVAIGKRTVNFNDMIRVEDYIHDLNHDISILNDLVDALDTFGSEVEAGVKKDEKIQTLVKVLSEKQECANKKAVVFTTYSDTALYIYECLLKEPSLQRIALVTGNSKNDVLQKTLKRFAPYSKLYLEKNWNSMYEECELDKDTYFDVKKNKWKVPFAIWKECIRKTRTDIQEILDNPIDIIVATDCLSEGQNLQDADLVINFDIHWNPVRLIQRFGRIDRIGSPNEIIKSINFWPTDSLESYLRLSERISNRMICMNVAGSETITANEKIEEMEANNELRAEHDRRSLQAMHDNEISQIEDDSQVTLNTLSLSEFKEEAENYVKDKINELRKMPLGSFSGFKLNLERYADVPESIVALIRCRKDSKRYYLLCMPVAADREPFAERIDEERIFNLLKDTQAQPTFLPEWLEKGNVDRLKQLANLLKRWLVLKTQSETQNAMIQALSTGDISNLLVDSDLEESFNPDDYDLIAWDYVSPEK